MAAAIWKRGAPQLAAFDCGAGVEARRQQARALFAQLASQGED